MEIKAAVVHEKGGSFEIESVELEEPRADEVLIDMTAVGVCHTDLSVRDQYYPTPLPAVLGHEGSGVVEAVGEDVTGVSPGDHVVLSFDYDTTCSNCRNGDVAYCNEFFEHNFTGRRVEDGSSPISQNGNEISGLFFGQSSFATTAIAKERNVVVVPDDAPLELLGPLGCGIQTGAGGVINSLDPQAGSSMVIFGAGSVGLSALLGANIKGCTDIIQIDLVDSRLKKAEELGATMTINPEAVDDTNSAIQDELGGGADYSLETTGQPSVLRQAVDVLRQGGTCGVIGAPPLGTEVSLDVNTILFGRTVQGIIEGDSHPKEFIPDLVELYQQGKFPFDEFVTYYDFDDIQQAVADSESGEVIKPILRMDQ
ncbi:NAD(P)-dependent alcohol dehydrogenase [Natronocalculus amylovorans]|uniref:NAD(P)-dependent alcohol dehydrogenase n=1 Tax=Natronocalculus amylovorans TaxID=2917812 RepID=A0AAE3FVW0_9EURY|nr:NAD(P)-dependent alcohol dehydrogenase [Natronocalculus amylovorans]MCL9816181.1 NAD(P)-dependent alcohol dehydrogenase [Natronocalculus amylovorans]NUE03280.1 NAD(P)-dependent alcohol dehydrogenase [Halorubraceae archaeon YAN]